MLGIVQLPDPGKQLQRTKCQLAGFNLYSCRQLEAIKCVNLRKSAAAVYIRGKRITRYSMAGCRKVPSIPKMTFIIVCDILLNTQLYWTRPLVNSMKAVSRFTSSSRNNLSLNFASSSADGSSL